MAIHFDTSSFGQVIINGRSHGDILVIGHEVEARDDSRLDLEMGSDHAVGDWEIEALLSNDPEVIIIGTGTAGRLRVNPRLEQELEKLGVELIVLTTPLALEEYNSLIKMGKKVNALIHATC